MKSIYSIYDIRALAKPKENKLELDPSIIFCPNYCISKKNQLRAAKYHILLNYAFNKLNVKDILRKANEVDKIRSIIIDPKYLDKMNIQRNPFPTSENEMDIWKRDKNRSLLMEFKYIANKDKSNMNLLSNA